MYLWLGVMNRTWTVNTGSNWKDDNKAYSEENLDLSPLPIFSEKQAYVGDLSLKQHGKLS